MGRRQEAARTFGIQVDQLGGDISKPALVIANPFQGQRLAVPRDVRLGDTPEGEPAILWSVPHWVSRDIRNPGYGRPDWASGERADKAIWAFVELASEADPERFVKFTRRYGPLGLWPYRTGQTNEKGQEIRLASLVDREGRDIWVPSVREGIYTPARCTTIVPGFEYWTPEGRDTMRLLYEPISEWQRWAMWTRAVLEIGLALRDGRLGTRDQWAVFGIEDDWYSRYFLRPSYQRRELTALLQSRFLKWSGLAPVIRWSGELPSLELAFGGAPAVMVPRYSMQHDWPENALVPALVASLLAIIIAGGPAAACSICGKPHPRPRKARVDQHAYCDACRPEAERARKRKSAAKRRAGERQSAATAPIGAGTRHVTIATRESGANRDVHQPIHQRERISPDNDG